MKNTSSEGHVIPLGLPPPHKPCLVAVYEQQVQVRPLAEKFIIPFRKLELSTRVRVKGSFDATVMLCEKVGEIDYGLGICGAQLHRCLAPEAVQAHPLAAKAVKQSAHFVWKMGFRHF